MHSSLKLLLSLVLLPVVLGPFASGKDDKESDKNKTSEKNRKPGDKKKDEKKKDKKKGDDKKGPKNAEDGGDDGKLSLPMLVPGHDSKGLKIPYYDGKGNLKMNFTIGIANRIDDENVRMREMEVETYDEAGKVEMKVVLPESVLNLKTSIVTSQTNTTISRDDFVITGDSIRFDTKKKEAALVGNVHMTVYDLNDEAGKPKTSNARHE